MACPVPMPMRRGTMFHSRGFRVGCTAPLNKPIHPSIHSSIHPSIHPSIHIYRRLVASHPCLWVGAWHL